MNLQVREASEADRQAIADVINAAFGDTQGPEVAALTADLLADPSAAPMLSLIATFEDRVVGHILFTNARLARPGPPVAAAILAPLAVLPAQQGRGIGGRLIQEGLAQLAAAGVELVFVLGHPGYYPRHGFSPAGSQGLDAPYPIPPEHADAWMVQALRPGILGQVRGRLNCAAALDDPRHWRE